MATIEYGLNALKYDNNLKIRSAKVLTDSCPVTDKTIRASW